MLKAVTWCDLVDVGRPADRSGTCRKMHLDFHCVILVAFLFFVVFLCSFARLATFERTVHSFVNTCRSGR